MAKKKATKKKATKKKATKKKATKKFAGVRLLSSLSGVAPAKKKGDRPRSYTMSAGEKAMVGDGPFSEEDCRRMIRAGYAVGVDGSGKEVAAEDLGIELVSPQDRRREVAALNQPRETADANPGEAPRGGDGPPEGDGDDGEDE